MVGLVAVGAAWSFGTITMRVQVPAFEGTACGLTKMVGEDARTEPRY